MATHPNLEMLANATSPDALAAAAEALRRDGVDPEIVAAIGAAAESLQSTLADRDRREAELLALFETAGDLSSLRDMDLVLEAIVERARLLLGSDVAYLTLFDRVAGDTFMRVTAGIVSDAFKQVRLPTGKGLGGLVAETLHPQSTSDYLRDPQYAHTNLIDDAVAGEGLIAILGVPITLGDQAIGVLFAADRHQRPFADAEIALLQSLADHAAIALENARLFEEAQRALAELMSANEVIRSQNESLETVTSLHERLSTLVLEGGGMADVARAAGAALGGYLIVADPAGRVLATAGEPLDHHDPGALVGAVLPREGALATALAAALERAKTTGRSAAVADAADVGSDSTLSAGKIHRLVSVALAGQEVLGFIVCSRRGPVTDLDRRSLERTAQVTALLLLGERTVAEAEQRVRGELLNDLLSESNRDIGALTRRAALLGVDLGRAHVVLVVAVATADRHALASAAGRLAAEHGGLVASREGDVVLALPGEDPSAAAELVSRALEPLAVGPVTIGAAGPAIGAGELTAAFREAQRCRAVLVALGREGDWATRRQLGVHGLLLGSAGLDELDAFVAATVGAVVDYDRDRGADLLVTLETFLAERGSLTRTSERLFIHVNTLRQRLERLDHLLGESWREADESLQLQLALQIRRLIAAM